MIEKTPSGKFRVRLKVNERRRYVGTYETEEEAREVEDAMGQAAPVLGPTLRSWGAAWLDKREVLGDIRSIGDDRRRWKHIEESRFIDRSLVELTPANIETWIEHLQTKPAKRSNKKAGPLNPRTVKSIIQLLSCLKAAVPKHIPASPMDTVSEEVMKRAVKRRSKDTGEPWTYLEPDEQHALATCTEIPEAHRLMLLFALCTGVRLGEQFNLELSDVKATGADPHIIVRFGSKGRRPKNGKMRRVPLFGQGLEVTKRWLEILPIYAPKNPENLLFPSPGGARSMHSKHLLIGPDPKVPESAKGRRKRINLFPHYLELTGIKPAKRHDGRHVRWHDLRHSVLVVQ
jgi:integrase